MGRRRCRCSRSWCECWRPTEPVAKKAQQTDSQRVSARLYGSQRCLLPGIDPLVLRTQEGVIANSWLLVTPLMASSGSHFFWTTQKPKWEILDHFTLTLFPLPLPTWSPWIPNLVYQPLRWLLPELVLIPFSREAVGSAWVSLCPPHLFPSSPSGCQKGFLKCKS